VLRGLRLRGLNLPRLAFADGACGLRDIWHSQAPPAMAGVKKFVDLFGDRYPKATKCLLDDLPELLVFFDHPAAHWMSIRRTKPIESAFPTICNRTKLTRGAMNRQCIVAMVFKLGIEALKRWRRIIGYSQLANVCAFFLYRGDRLACLGTSPKLPSSCRSPDAPILNY